MTDLIGQSIGHYQITERLGRGGMAEIYKAFHKELEIYRAIKFIRAEFGGSEDFRARFLKEAQGVARLQHPNIVQIHDFGESDDRYYMVMEFVEGRTLKDVLRDSGQMPIEKSVELVKTVAGALAYAHDQGLVHRDIKPDNIMIDARGRPVLMDFGIAKLLTGDAKITQTGHLIGTPAYMAPEQSKGEDVAPATDIYALSVVLFEMLTGHTPYEADTPMAVVLKSLSDPMPMPRSFNTKISEELQGVILKGTAKSVTERYRTASEFVAGLDRAMDRYRARTMEETVRLPSPGGAVVQGSNKGALLLLVLAVLAVGAGGVWWWVQRDNGMRAVPPEAEPAMSSAPETVASPGETTTPQAVADGAKSAEGAAAPAEIGQPPVAASEPEAEPEPPALALTLDITPADATVIIDGDAGRYAPGMQLPPGTYAVQVMRDGYVSWSGDVVLSDRNVAQSVRLQRAVDTQALARDAAAKRDAEEQQAKQAAERAAALAAEEQARRAQAAVVDVETLVARATPVMVKVPAGRFTMGCQPPDPGCLDEEKPSHEVTIRAFRLSRGEITFAQYDAFADATKRAKPDDKGWGRDNRPVMNVNWMDAIAFTEWLSGQTGVRYRLPTEAEWEYAARAGTTTVYSWGNDVGFGNANCPGCGSNWDGDRTAPSGSFPANAFGLHDMHGNVWEWVQDCWQPGYADAPGDGSARRTTTCSAHVLRGGSWLDNPSYLRVAYRNWLGSALKDVNIGFRVAVDE
ncbi:MAG: SUMF1/EgtB/PvdO family nonheme iron enzyme [Pseudomonadales bacterium]